MLRSVLVLACCFLLFSCSGDRTDVVLRDSGGFNLRKTDYNELVSWKADNLFLFDKTIRTVCNKISSSKDAKIKSGAFEYSIDEYKKHCLAIDKIKDNSMLKRYIEDNFVPYAVSFNGDEFGKFTSYYEAEIRASFYKDDKYKYPIYGKPNDLIEFNLRDFDNTLPNKRFVGRVKDNKLVRYYTRRKTVSDAWRYLS